MPTENSSCTATSNWQGHSRRWLRDLPLNRLKIFFDKKVVILCLQTNLTQWFHRSFVHNTADKVLWRGFWTVSEYKLRNMVRKRLKVLRWWKLRPPLGRFLEWPLISLNIERCVSVFNQIFNFFSVKLLHYKPLWFLFERVFK